MSGGIQIIKKIYLKNFRSIYEDTIEFQPLTVIVGANNTGKSNLIKSLEFIGNVSRYGLERSVREKGGYLQLVPKSMNYDLSTKDPLIISIDFILPPGPDDTDQQKRLTCSYELEIRARSKKLWKTGLVLNKEKLTLHDILWVGSKYRNSDKPYKNKSSISITNIKNKSKIIIDLKPNFTNLNKELFFEWLFSGNKPDFIKEFKKTSLTKKQEVFTNFIERLIQSTKNTSPSSGVKPNEAIFQTVLSDMCTHFNVVKNQLSGIKRYDLLIKELRTEQVISSEYILEKHGSNLPSVIDYLSKNKKESWSRIIETITEISPLIQQVNQSTLSSGKEFLHFKEVFKGRKIESWESSDGSLRALGILAAMESQEEYNTVLIEEPEIGLHPWAIKPLIDHIRYIIKKKNVQVILTTHSDQILENVKRDEVLICSRSLEEGTKFKKINEISPISNKDMVDIGKIWKKGLLGGVP